MKETRRQFTRALLAGIVAFLVGLALPEKARACLYGTWKVQCPNCKQVDTVTDGTCQHKCENCKTQVFSGDDVTIVCRNNHATRITIKHPATDSFVCPSCKTDCNFNK